MFKRLIIIGLLLGFNTQGGTVNASSGSVLFNFPVTNPHATVSVILTKKGETSYYNSAAVNSFTTSYASVDMSRGTAGTPGGYVLVVGY